MYKKIVDDARRTMDDARRTPDIGRSQKLTMSTLCSGEQKRAARIILDAKLMTPSVDMFKQLNWLCYNPFCNKNPFCNNLLQNGWGEHYYNSGRQLQPVL